jgi:UPF0755 protein
MSQRRSPLLTFLGLLILTLLCAAMISVAALLMLIPQRAVSIYGPATAGLSFNDRLYLSTILILNQDQLTNPYNPYGTPLDFEVGLGEPASSIMDRLDEYGLIPNVDPFRAYLQYSGLDTSIQAGEYQLSAAMTPIQIAYALQDATPTHVQFRILAGWRLEEIAEALPTSGLAITPGEFLFATYNPSVHLPGAMNLPPAASLEGYLSPGSYKLHRNVSVEQMLEAFLEQFTNQLTPDLIDGFENQGLNLHLAVILASIVERESVDENEMPMIASVFINRLAVGMRLDTDPTVQYALGYNEEQNTWWTNPLSLVDLEVDSPYNTYRYSGLPPGPIATPSLAALKAVAYPATTPYYYFRAACDNSGGHVFAKTFEEHVGNACP